MPLPPFRSGAPPSHVVLPADSAFFKLGQRCQQRVRAWEDLPSCLPSVASPRLLSASSAVEVSANAVAQLCQEVVLVGLEWRQSSLVWGVRLLGRTWSGAVERADVRVRLAGQGRDLHRRGCRVRREEVRYIREPQGILPVSHAGCLRATRDVIVCLLEFRILPT